MDFQVDPLAVIVAIGALGAALWANATARDAARAAADSAKEAKRSADAAEDANAIARQARAQALEVTDVVWQGESRQGVVTFRNVGSTIAKDVTAVVRINGRRHDLVAGDVEVDKGFECDGSEELERARAANAATTAKMNQAGIAYVGVPSFKVEARISWYSAAGAPGVVTIDKVTFKK